MNTLADGSISALAPRIASGEVSSAAVTDAENRTLLAARRVLHASTETETAVQGIASAMRLRTVPSLPILWTSLPTTQKLSSCSL